jgi:WD40 repeat protein
LRLNRYLIAAGTKRYLSGSGFEELDDVPEELERVIATFKRFDYVEQLTDLRLNPDAQTFVEKVEAFLRAPDRSTQDVIVVYYTGHGFSEDRSHYLAAANTGAGSIATAIDSASFVKLRPKGSPLRHILVILDACSSAAGAAAAAEIGAQLRERGAAEGAGVWTLAAAGTREEAFQLAFVEALELALEDAAKTSGTVPEHLAVETLVHHINGHLAARYGGEQRAFYSPPGGLAAGTPPFFPHPAFDLLGGSGVDLETRQRLGRDLETHFDPKSRGVDRAADPGSYFKGRRGALEALRTWLADGDARPRVVCGQPGAGKSAVLGRLLHLSGVMGQPPAGEDEGWPPIDAALLARNKDASRLTRELSAALGFKATGGIADLVAQLNQRDQTVRIVLDALDEADGPIAVASDLLLPLVENTEDRVRLAVGSRESTRRRLPFEHVPIDLDKPAYLDAEDLIDYVAAVLMADADPEARTPYRGRPREARMVAEEVAARANGSFLIARVAARTVSRGTHVLEPGELASMSAVWRAVGTAFDQDLGRSGADAERVRDLLTPLAWTQGAGLPWETLWAPIATAISGLVYTDDDVAWVQEQAGAYVVEAAEDGRAVFRLIHQELADHLRDDHRTVPIEAAIVDACLEQVPERPGGGLDWALAHPYIRRYLATHAAAAERIDELLVDPGFLTTADPGRVSRAARAATTVEGAAAAAVHLLAAEDLVDLGPPERAARLSLIAHQRMQRWLVDALEPLLDGAPWVPAWTDWVGDDPSRVVTRLPTRVTCSAAFSDGERWFYAAGDRSGRIRILDALSEERWLDEHLDEMLQTIRPAAIDGCWFILAGDFQGRLHVWRVSDWEHTVVPAHGSVLGAIAVGQVDGSTVVFTAGRSGRLGSGSSEGRGEGPGVVRSWKPGSWRPLTPERRAFWGVIRQLDLVEVDGRPVLIATGDAWGDPEESGGVVRAFDPVSLAPLFHLPTGRPPVVRSAIAPEGALLLLGFIAAFKDRLSRWDLQTRAMTAQTEVEDGASQSLALAHLNGMPVAAVALNGGIQLYDVASLAALPGWRQIVTREPQHLAYAEPAGRSILLSGGDDGALREWDLGWTTTTADESKSASPVYSLAIGGGADESFVVAGRMAGLEVIDLADGGRQEGPRLGSVPAIAVVGSHAVVGTPDGFIRMFELPDWHEAAAVEAHEGGVSRVDLYADRTDLLCASTGADHRVRLWEGTALESIARPLGHEGYEDKSFGMLRFQRVNGELVVFAGGYDGHLVMWDVDKLPPEDSFLWELGTVSRDSPSGHSSSLVSLALLATARFEILFSGAWDGTVSGLCLDTGEWWTPESKHMAAVRAMCAASTGSEPVLVTGADDGYLGFWRVGDANVALVNKLPLGYPVTSLAASGDMVVAGTTAGLVAIRLRENG